MTIDPRRVAYEDRMLRLKKLTEFVGGDVVRMAGLSLYDMDGTRMDESIALIISVLAGLPAVPTSSLARWQMGLRGGSVKCFVVCENFIGPAYVFLEW